VEGVTAFFALFLLLERLLGVLERREAGRLVERERRKVELERRRKVERRLDSLERREAERCWRFGVLERRAERLEADLDREVDRRRLTLRFFGALGVLARLAALRRRVVVRRSADRRREPSGVRDLRELLFLFGVRERMELRDEALEDDFLGAFGDLARRAVRRLDVDRDVEAEREERRFVPLGALALRQAALRRLSEVRVRLFCALGVLDRRTERRREALRELDLFAFFAVFSASSSFRARFFLCLIPISLFLFATILVLYSFFHFTYVW